jgi:hypothetical protein
MASIAIRKQPDELIEPVIVAVSRYVGPPQIPARSQVGPTWSARFSQTGEQPSAVRLRHDAYIPASISCVGIALNLN